MALRSIIRSPMRSVLSGGIAGTPPVAPAGYGFLVLSGNYLILNGKRLILLDG